MNSILAAVALCTVSSAAWAQDQFASQGTAAFSADRMMGFGVSHVSIDPEAPGADDRDDDGTHFTFMWRGRRGPTPFDVPRLAFDYYVIDQLSIGGSIGYANYTSDDDPDDMPEHSEFLLAPRVGYTWMFSRVVGFWLRGGVTYHSFSSDPFDESGFAFTIEPTFVFAVVPHFGFTAGVNADFDLVGSRDGGGPFDEDVHYRSIGIQLGLIGWL
jgi:hypothetical protein